MAQIYTAKSPPPPRTKPLEPWTEKNVKVTDGSERQLGKDAFLKMLLAQLKNQDPLNPMENTDMSAQLAQFSQLEQLTNMGKSIDNMVNHIQAQNQFQTLNMIGKNVKAQANVLSLDKGVSTIKSYVQTNEPANLKVYIVDEKGNQVRMMDWGMKQAGAYEIQWDGRNNLGQTMPDGTYYFRVGGTNMSGENIKNDFLPTVEGKVSAVSFDERGQPIIHLDKAKINLSQVVEILQAHNVVNDDSESTLAKKPKNDK